jgi:hypothetical protein
VRLAKEKDSAAATERQAAYDAALARLAQAEEEAANASKARDAAIARADRERARAAALQPSTPVESSVDGSASPGGGLADLHSTLLLQKAAALLNLHAQAVAVNNIRSLVHIVLDVDSNHFNHWRNQFLLVLGKFSLQAHVLATPAPSPDWDRMDCIVKSWILDSLTDDLAEIVSSQGATARDAWLAVESQSLGNWETRAIQLETKFRNFVQGGLSITEYCRRLKKMADDLTALGEVVTDRTLVLNALRGLNERFTHIGALLRRARRFPTFLEVKDDMSLDELTLGSHPPSPAAALAATTKSASHSGTGNGAGSKPNRRGKHGSGGGGGSGGSGGPTQQQHTAQQQPQQAGGAKPVSLPSGAGPPSTTPGRAPSNCGRVPAILLWRPYLDRRSSNRRSSPNSSRCPSHTNCSNRSCSRTSSLLLHLAPLRSANGVRPAPTTPWPASLPGIHSRSPPRSARQH